VQDGQTNNIAVLISHYDIVIGDFAVGGVARLFEVDVEDEDHRYLNGAFLTAGTIFRNSLISLMAITVSSG